MRMKKLYTNYSFFCSFLFLMLLSSTGAWAKNGEPATTTNPDSLAKANEMGHLKCIVETDTNCVTKQITLEAWIEYSFTGVMQAVTVPWNTGQVAHKIIVTPPGYWTWDVTGIGCESTHWLNYIDLPNSFFQGGLEIQGPPAICPFEEVELTVFTNGYDQFTSYEWSPAFDDFSPITISGPGTYTLVVEDAYGCPFTDQVFIPQIPPFVPQITGPTRMCPEGDTVTLVVQGPYTNHMWNSGDLGNPLTVTGPGVYEVTATDANGCTGVGYYGVESAGVDPFSISVTSPSLCPGQLDTLRVVGGFSQYVWSNGTTGITNIVNQAGTYIVTVTNIFGCSGTSSVTVNPLFPPNIAISSTPLCPGGTATLSVSNGPFVNYQWSTSQTSSSISISNTGTYSVSVSGGGICPTTTQTVVNLADIPVTTIADPALLTCTVQSDTLDASASSNGSNFPFVWSTIGGHFVSGDSTLTPLVDSAGTYILTITNLATGCITRDTVVVNQNVTPPGANPGPPATLTCVNTTLFLGPVPAPSDSTLQPVWTTQGGHFIAGDSTWAPHIDQPGVYLLTVTSSVNQCTSTASINIPINTIPPQASIVQPGILTCTQNTVLLNSAGSSSGANFTYSWSTTNGTIVGPSNGATASAASVGTYILTVTNLINGCTSTASAVVSADINIPTVSALTPAVLTCNLTSTTIDATASSSGTGYTYNWTSPTGTIVSGGNTLTPLVGAPGIYTLNLLNTINNCQATLSVTVSQDIAAPLSDAGPNNTLSCTATSLNLDGSGSAAGSNYLYQWSTSNGTILSGSTGLAPLVGATGTYTLVVTNTVNGCTSSSSTIVLEDVNAPQAIIAPPAILNCVTTSLQLNGAQSSQGTDYSCIWSGPGIVQGGSSYQPTVNQPGNYCVTVTNSANGCTETACTPVAQDIVAPPAEAGNPLLINCYQPSGTVGSSINPSGSGFTIVWSTTNGNIVSGGNGPTPIVNQPGTYNVLVTNTQNGCTSTDQVLVTDDFVPPLADAGQTFELTCVSPSTVLQGTGSTGSIFTYQWNGPLGGILSGATTLNPTVNISGTYQLRVTNTQNGCTSTDQVVITESADKPDVVTATPPVLTCALTSLNLSAAGSSTGPQFSYLWSTGNGTITAGATTLTPTVADPGLYTITITDNTNSCTSVASIQVQENVQNPVINAGPDNTLTCAVTSLTLQSQIVSSSSPNISYTWQTAGGQIISGINSSAPVIGAPGLYTVTVTDAINGCTGTDQLSIGSDLVQPTAAIGTPQTLTCTLTQTPLQTTGSSTGNNFVYVWSTSGTGVIVSTTDPTTPVVGAPGVYNLVITNTSNGCSRSTSVTVPQNIVNPTAEAGQTVGLDCDTQTNSLNGAGSSAGNFSYLWTTTGNGSIVSGSTTLTPVIGTPGTYTIRVTDNVNGCTSTDQVLVTQDINPPVFSIATPQVLTCSLTSVPVSATGTGFGPTPQFVWTTNNGSIVSGGNTLNATVNDPGNYTLTATNTVNGCSTTASVVVTENVTPPAIQVQPAPLLTCTVGQVTLQSTPQAQTTLQWSTTNGHIVSGANTPNPIVDKPGNYQVVVTSLQNGCTNTNIIPVQQEMNMPTGVEFALEHPKCNGTPGQLQVNQIQGGVGPFSYSIDGGQTFFSYDQFSDLAPGSFELVIQDANGCEITRPVTIIAPLYPLVTSPPEFSLALGEEQQIKAIVPAPFPLSEIEQVIWTPTEGLTFPGTSIQDLLKPTAMPFQTTTYTVTIITPEGCKSEARTTINVNRKVDIYAPNVIWPEDPDGDNAAFTLFAQDVSVAIIHKLQIFDRWGSNVFENRDFQPNDLRSGWDGTFRGEPVNPAVFVWYAEVELVDGRNILLKGDVTVVR